MSTSFSPVGNIIVVDDLSNANLFGDLRGLPYIVGDIVRFQVERDPSLDITDVYWIYPDGSAVAMSTSPTIANGTAGSGNARITVIFTESNLPDGVKIGIEYGGISPAGIRTVCFYKVTDQYTHRLLRWSHPQDAFGIDFTSDATWTQQCRVPLLLWGPEYPIDFDEFETSNGVTLKLNTALNKQWSCEIGPFPDRLIQGALAAINCRTVLIDGVQYTFLNMEQEGLGRTNAHYAEQTITCKARQTDFYSRAPEC